MQKKIQLLKWVAPMLTILVLGVAGVTGPLQPTKADSSGGSCQLTWNSGITLNPGNVPSEVQTALSSAHLTNCTQQHTSCTLVQGSGNTTLNYDNLRGSSDTLISNLEKDNINLNCDSANGGSFFSNNFSNSNLVVNNSSSNTCDSGNTNSNGVNNNSGGSSKSNNCHFNSKPPDGSCELAWKDGGGGGTTLDASQVTDQGLQKTLGNYQLWCAGSQTSCKLAPSSSNNGINSGDPKLNLDNVAVSPYVHDGLLNKYGLDCGASSASNGNGDGNGNGNNPSIEGTNQQGTRVRPQINNLVCGANSPHDKTNRVQGHYSIQIGGWPPCNSVLWSFSATQGRTCTFSVPFYQGGHAWVMNVFKDGPTGRDVAYLITSNFTTPPIDNVSQIAVSMAQNDAQFGNSGDLTGNELDVGLITYSCN